MRRTAAVTGAVVASLAATGVAVATSEPTLAATGGGSVEGTDASAVFRLGDRTVRQVRYRDRGTLRYSFEVENDGWRTVTVTGLQAPDPQPRLFRYERVVDADGDTTFSVPARGSTRVTVELLMRGCESLSARAGSFVQDVALEVEGRDEPVVVAFPEEVRAGSPREAGCADATASSRPPG